MRLNNKTLIIPIIALFVFSTKVSWGQYPGMAAVRQQWSNQWAQQQMQMQMNSMMFLNNAEIPNYKYDYEVILKDSTKIMIKSKIYNDTSKHKTYLLLVDKSIPKSDMAHRERKIYPDQTLSISRKVENTDTTTIPFRGMPTDSCWLFKTITARISAYSFLSEQGDEFFYSTITGIQKGNGPIIHFSLDNLKQMIADDPDAMKFFDKKKYPKALDRYNRDADKAAKK